MSVIGVEAGGTAVTGLYPGVWAWLVPLLTWSWALLTRPQVWALSSDASPSTLPTKPLPLLPPPPPTSPQGALGSSQETPNLWAWHFLKCHTAQETFQPHWLIEGINHALAVWPAGSTHHQSQSYWQADFTVRRLWRGAQAFKHGIDQTNVKCKHRNNSLVLASWQCSFELI